ncbi:hypothetical protein AA313_de0207217 [Arthrobotrys entomopaga]|nr:hypothetical protein AA313_de0207217 [Arthrobotrys entomopaga]
MTHWRYIWNYRFVVSCSLFKAWSPTPSSVKRYPRCRCMQLSFGCLLYVSCDTKNMLASQIAKTFPRGLAQILHIWISCMKLRYAGAYIILKELHIRSLEHEFVSGYRRAVCV